jgi:hypothetical protein
VRKEGWIVGYEAVGRQVRSQLSGVFDIPHRNLTPLIVATALYLGASVFTRDEKIKAIRPWWRSVASTFRARTASTC